jgi:hypothetical protein
LASSMVRSLHGLQCKLNVTGMRTRSTSRLGLNRQPRSASVASLSSIACPALCNTLTPVTMPSRVIISSIRPVPSQCFCRASNRYFGAGSLSGFTRASGCGNCMTGAAGLCRGFGSSPHISSNGNIETFKKTDERAQRFRSIMRSNETELSHRWGKRVLLRSLMLKSCESSSSERPAVGCSDLLDLLRGYRQDHSRMKCSISFSACSAWPLG